VTSPQPDRDPIAPLPGGPGRDIVTVMTVRRIKPNIRSDRFEESRAFYNGVIGLDGGGGLDWILFFGTDRREVQLSVMKLDIRAHVHPDVSIEVDDVDEVHARAVAAGSEIVYPLTDEEWGLRRFFVRDPNGTVLNITEHDER
jgi:catechol 2,3-dioxygenase-like lactoylglutathione lyase family enzyme